MSDTGPTLRPRTARSIHEERFGPNMTPMIDVVLVILIFFMAGSTFLGQEWFLKSELLKRGVSANQKDPLQLPPIKLNLRLVRAANGETTVTGMGETPLDFDSFTARVADFTRGGGADTAQIIVIIEPDPGVTYNDVVRVHEACITAGIERIGITERQ